MSDRDASLDEASNIAFKALKEKPPAKPVDLYYILNISHPLYSTVLISHSCNTKKQVYKNLGIKKEPNGSDVKNIK